MRSMSQSSISFGKARCAGSRTGEGGEHRQPVGLVPVGAAAEMGELDHHRRTVVVAVVGQRFSQGTISSL